MTEGLLKREKLTKAFFLTLSEGNYLSSNTGDKFRRPIFAEMVTPSEGRDAQWQRIKKAGADRRLCNVFKDKGSCVTWQEQLPKDPDMKACQRTL